MKNGTSGIRLMATALCIVAALTIAAAHAKDQSGVLKATEIMKMKVEGTDGKSLGHIRDLVIDPEEGDIDYAVLDFGGIAGLGDKYFAVPWEALQLDLAKKKILLDVTKKDLKKAPGFDKKHWPNFDEQKVIIYEFYEVPLPEGPKGGEQSNSAK
ncbi:MAG TPA: PRC-barrel domain-containing protein [Nitrospira sp.]|nr:PRC-barrel domain-containing protein [Nitrospira sp.]